MHSNQRKSSRDDDGNYFPTKEAALAYEAIKSAPRIRAIEERRQHDARSRREAIVTSPDKDSRVRRRYLEVRTMLLLEQILVEQGLQCAPVVDGARTDFAVAAGDGKWFGVQVKSSACGMFYVRKLQYTGHPVICVNIKERVDGSLDIQQMWLFDGAVLASCCLRPTLTGADTVDEKDLARELVLLCKKCSIPVPLAVLNSDVSPSMFLEHEAHRKIAPFVPPTHPKKIGDVENAVYDHIEVRSNSKVQEKVVNMEHDKASGFRCTHFCKYGGTDAAGNKVLIPYDEEDNQIYRFILLQDPEDGSFSRPYLSTEKRKEMTDAQSNAAKQKIAKLVVAGWWDIPSDRLVEKRFVSSVPPGASTRIEGKLSISLFPSESFACRHDIPLPTKQGKIRSDSSVWTRDFFREPPL